MNPRIRRLKIMIPLFLLTFIVGVTVAWLAVNRNVFTGMNALQLNTSGLKIDHYNVYRYNYETNEIDNAYNTQDKYDLVSYDSIFEERNENTLLIFEVFLYNFAPDTESFTVYVDRKSTDAEWDSDDEHYTSNLIYIKAGTGGTLNVTHTGTTDAFAEARNAFKDIALKNHFIEVEKNGRTYTLISETDRITLPIELSASEKSLISGADGKDQMIPVYFIFDYEDLLIQAQNINHFSDIQIIDNATIVYENDIKSILFEQ